MILEGTVINGVVVLDNGQSVPDGTWVSVAIKEQAESPCDEGVGTPKDQDSQAPARTDSESPTTLGQRLLKLAGIAEGLPSDMAEQHDHYIHGTPKR